MSKNLEAAVKLLLVLALLVVIGHTVYTAAMAEPRTDKWVQSQLNRAAGDYYDCYRRGTPDSCQLPDHVASVRTGEVVVLTATANTGNRYAIHMHYRKGLGTTMDFKCQRKHDARPCRSWYGPQ